MKRRINTINGKVLTVGGSINELKEHELKVGEGEDGTISLHDKYGRDLTKKEEDISTYHKKYYLRGVDTEGRVINTDTDDPRLIDIFASTFSKFNLKYLTITAVYIKDGIEYPYIGFPFMVRVFHNFEDHGIDPHILGFTVDYSSSNIAGVIFDITKADSNPWYASNAQLELAFGDEYYQLYVCDV